MIFSRRRRPAPLDEASQEAATAAEQTAGEPAEQGGDASDEPELEAGAEGQRDEWADLDDREGLRDEGPFDITEVDLDADDVERLDFGSLILTPVEGMQLQLQIEEETGQVNAALVLADQSALELALFAAPTTSGMAADVRGEIIEATEQQGGQATLADGPFGAEIRRVLPMKGPEGEDLVHISRTWLAQGPGWLLRGVLMGEAATLDGVDGPTEILFDFFCNVVVRRGEGAKVPGDLISMTLPEGLVNTDE